MHRSSMFARAPMSRSRTTPIRAFSPQKPEPPANLSGRRRTTGGTGVGRSGCARGPCSGRLPRKNPLPCLEARAPTLSGPEGDGSGIFPLILESREAHLVLNPAADRGRSGARRGVVSRFLEERGVTAAWDETPGPGEAGGIVGGVPGRGLGRGGGGGGAGARGP